MKTKTIIISSALALGLTSNTASAQGLLGKLKDKVAQASGGAVGGGSREIKASFIPKESFVKEGKEDIEDKTLDAIPFAKTDPLGINGIYYSTEIIYGQEYVSEARTIHAFQKFHINHIPEEKSIHYVFNTRSTLDKTKRDTYIEPLDCSREIQNYKYDKKAGMFALAPYHYIENFKHIAPRFSEYMNEGQKLCDEKEAFPTVYNAGRGGEYYMLEPGIIVLMKNLFYGSGSILNYEEKCLTAFQKTYMPIILYKKEKEVRAKAITKEEIHKLFSAYDKKYKDAIENAVVGENLPRPGDASTSPVFDDAKANILGAFKTYLAGEQISQFVPIYAYGYFDGAQYSDYMIPHPITGIQVRAGRIVDYYVVCKNLTPGAKNKNPMKEAKGQYVYFHVVIYNLVKNQQYNTDNYETTWKVFRSSSPAEGEIDEAEDVMKYKGK